MYSIKPIIQSNVLIDIPSCMYPMKNIYNYDQRGTTREVSAATDRTVNGEMENLELRQQKILEQLKELKEKLMSMHKELKICAKPAQPTQKENTEDSNRIVQKPINTDKLQDLVINANPKNVPYSLLAIKKLWKSRINIKTQCYMHSSVPQLFEDAAAFEKSFNKSNDSTIALPTLQIILIWKNVTNTEMICAPSTYIPIYGEVNILRYLMRIGPNELAYESYADECNKIDSTLDECHQMIKSETIKDKLNILRNFGTKLGKQSFFGGSGISIMDIAISSAVKQSLEAKDITPNITKWLERISEFVGY